VGVRDEDVAICAASDAVYFGAIGDPRFSDPKAKVRPEQALLRLRKDLALYANLRPVTVQPILAASSPVRESLVRDVDAGSVHSFLDAIGGMVRAHMATVNPVQAISEVLFENLGFKGGDYGEAENYYLVPALERRTGIPIVLCSLYVLVGRRVGLPVTGVAAPSHYLVRVERADGPVFVDCYNRGRLYRPETLANWLEGRGLSEPEQYLGPCSNRFTLLRMMNNLERFYADQNDVRMAGLVRRLRGYLEPNR
jgi:regulator of sirC expression with transglutaminase-like and TPR domain